VSGQVKNAAIIVLGFVLFAYPLHAKVRALHWYGEWLGRGSLDVGCVRWAVSCGLCAMGGSGSE
jgi:hypothetical protein